MDQVADLTQEEEGASNIAVSEVFVGTRNADVEREEQAAPAAAEAPGETAAEARARRLAKRQSAAEASDWMLDTFRMCAADARKCMEADENATTATWKFLGSIFDATKNKHWIPGSFKIFCQARGIPCTRATLRNPYKALITASRNSGGYPEDPKGKEASRLGRALVWADRQKVEAGSLPDFLSKNGGVSGCVAALVADNKKKKAAGAASFAQQETGDATDTDVTDDADDGVVG